MNIGLFYKKGLHEKFRDCEILSDLTIKKLKSHENNPFFIFIHFWDVHRPYNYKEKELLLKFPHDNELNSQYDAAIYNVDKEIGKIIQFLKEKGLIENTVVVITSDHGEGLGEHNIDFNHHTLYEPILHIPLIIYDSKMKNKEIWNKNKKI